MPSNNYESLKTDGHYTMAYRIFLKIKNWVQSKVQTDVPANAVFTDTLPTAYCTSSADATTKIAQCTNFSLKNNSYIPINFKNGNTVATGTGITLNINNMGAKPLYVDFVDDNSVPTDEPFNAGTYILYYTNQAYYLYTDGVLYPYRDVAKQNDLKYYSFGSQDGSVTIVEGSSTSGGATTYTENFLVQKVNGHTVNSDVPSNAVFTDTTYTAGDNVNISQQNVISADQIDDSYDYTQYQNLPSTTKMQDKLFIVDDVPDLDPTILNLVYPVGCYFETSDTTFNPNTTWGGTWVLEAEGLVHVSSGSNYTVSANNQDGGETSHTHGFGHTHGVPGVSHFHWTPMLSDSTAGVLFKANQPWNYGWTNINKTKVTSPNLQALGGSPQASTVSGYQIGTSSTTPDSTTTNSQSTSTTDSGSNMQPYKIVNRWHRVA